MGGNWIEAGRRGIGFGAIWAPDAEIVALPVAAVGGVLCVAVGAGAAGGVGD